MSRSSHDDVRAVGDAPADGVAREAARQQALVAAVLHGGAPPPGLEPAGGSDGLEAYRTNAAALAERALAAVFPTVQRAVGAPTFAVLAGAHARESPPACGDLGEWGASFPAWLAERPALKPWPWLVDSAHLDLAVHRCERAADARPDAASWSWLASEAPERLSLRFAPGTQLVRSRFPIALIQALHRSAVEPDVERLRAALDAGLEESVLVVREAWRARVHVLEGSALAFVAALLDDASIASALDAAGEGLDFTAWLASALQAGWLEGVVRDAAE